MIPKYKPIVDGFTPAVGALIRNELGLSPSKIITQPAYRLYEDLEAAGYSQADVVLVLVRHCDTLPPDFAEKYRTAVEALIGRPIVVLPPQPHHTPYPLVERAPPGPDDRRVQAVVRNPRLPTTDSFQRFKHFRIGASVRALLTRGVTRKDIREAVNNDWVVFS